MAIRTSHTVLAEVTSHGSGGRAEIVSGHRALTKGFTDPHLTSNYFTKHPIGQRVTVRVILSGRRRLTQSARIEDDARNPANFRIVYGDKLEQEARTYNMRHGLSSATGGSVVTSETVSAPTPVVSIEDVSEWTHKTYVSPKDKTVLEAIRKLSNKRHVAVMMIGPSGYGKTSIPQQMAADWGMNFLRWDCATVRDPEEFFGFRGAINGSTMDDNGDTIFAPSNFTEVIEKGNAIVVLDELNRIDPYISNILFPLLDHAGKTSVVGHEVKVGPNVIFFATLNLGFQFTGTFTLDTALTNRFAAKILVSSLPKRIEEKIIQARADIDHYTAVKIVKLMTALRALNEKGQLSIDASTRVSIQMAEMVGCGLDIKTALLYIVVNGVSEEEAKIVVDQYNYVIG